MKKLLIALFLLAQTTAWSKDVIYLSPNGFDTGDGSLEYPLYSLHGALEHIKASTSKDTAYVSIAAGVYYMDKPLVINEKDTRPIIFEGNNARFLGAIKIEGWQKCENGIWKTYIPETIRYGFTFEQVYIQGKRAVLARTPNEEWNYVKSSDETSYDKGVRMPKYATQRIYVEPDELKHLNLLSQEEQQRIKVQFYHKWDVTQKYIDYVQPDSGTIHISGSGMAPWNAIGAGSRYVLSNYKAALDAPGEWFLDTDGWLYYMPLADEDMTRAVCYAPTITQFLVFEGIENNPVKDKIFNNISFQYTSYKMPDSGNEPMQAAASIEAAIMADFTENCAFNNCEVSHVGAYGFWFRRECNNNKVEHCLLSDLGAGGIKIGEIQIRDNDRKVTHSNIINNNIIQHAGYVLPCGVGVAIFNASDNRVTHNEISDFRYSGVSIGWMWGYAETSLWTTVIDLKGVTDFRFGKFVSPSVRNIVEYNHIHHIGWGELSDMGAVYTLGESPGTRVCNNVIHDVLSYDYGGWGLYTDEGSTGVVMENNLVYRCKSGGFHQHYGKENIIRNNIFGFGHYYQLQFTRVEKHQSFTFRNNIIVQNSGVNLAGNWKEAIIDMDYNCYWDIRGGDVLFGDMPLKAWRKIKDAHSIVADPMFVDLTADNYTFKSLSTARKIGFTPFDYSKAGVYGSSTWKQRAQLSPDILNSFSKIAAIRTKK